MMFRLQLMVTPLSVPFDDFVSEVGSWHVCSELLKTDCCPLLIM